MTLTLIGWAVLHSLWQVTLIAGISALFLSTLPDRRARARHVISYACLIAMVVLPVATAFASIDPMGDDMRRPVMRAVEESVGLQSVLSARAIAVPAAAVLWIGGLLIYAARVRREWRRARQLQQLDLEAAGEPIELTLAELRTRLAVRTPVDVLGSRRATVPMVLGWLRPVILLPSHSMGSLPPAHLRAILAHELAHVRRRDYLANLIQMAAETLLFHHPAAHWISRRIRTEREYCCDDVAVSVGADAADYARALAALDDTREDCLMAVAAASGTLLDRIQRIAGHPRPMLTPVRGVAAFVGASIVAGIILTMTSVVPPSLPLDVKLRSKGPGPMGPVGPPPPGSLPRSPGR